MTEYDFFSLSDFEFERLVADLLARRDSRRYEVFARGPDGGIDARAAGVFGRIGTPAVATVVTCKHYARSGFSKLFGALEKDRPKLLKRGRVIVATSVDLTPANKEKIRRLHGTQVASTDDILGKQDLNQLLALYPDVERSYFKLWLSSTNVLQRVLHNNIWVRSDDLRAQLETRLQRYVQTEAHGRALDVLQRQHAVVIVGPPGVGKTMLAQILVAHYVAEQKFEPVLVSEDIDEADSLYDRRVRQVFYYDDFLGQTAGADKLGKNEDQRLLNFFARVRGAPDKRFILTTREYILRQAQSRHERLARGDLDLIKCIVDASDQTPWHRALVLYNHLYFSSLGHAARRGVAASRAYQKIIAHPNYSPRTLETVVQYLESGQVAIVDVSAEFLRVLERPDRIWSHIFDEQLSGVARDVLRWLVTFGDAVRLDSLIGVVRASGLADAADEVRRALRVLDGTFVRTGRVGLQPSVAWFSPALRDFCKSRVADDLDFRLRARGIALSFEQTQNLLVVSPEREWPALIDQAWCALDSAATRDAALPDGTSWTVRTSSAWRANWLLREHGARARSAPQAESQLQGLFAEWRQAAGSLDDCVELVETLRGTADPLFVAAEAAVLDALATQVLAFDELHLLHEVAQRSARGAALLDDPRVVGRARDAIEREATRILEDEPWSEQVDLLASAEETALAFGLVDTAAALREQQSEAREAQIEAAEDYDEDRWKDERPRAADVTAQVDALFRRFEGSDD